MKHYSICTDDNRTFAVSLSEAADNIIRQECSLEEAHPLAKLEEIQHTALLLLPDIWMQLQAWQLQAVAVVLIQVAGDGTKTKMNLNGHVVVREWQTKMCKRRKGLHR